MEKAKLAKLYLLILIGFFGFTLFFWFSPGHAEKIGMLYLWPIAIAVAAVSAVLDQNRVSGTYVAYGFCVWIWLTCVLNGDYDLVYNHHFLLGIVLTFGVFYPAFLVMRGKHIDRYFRIVAAVYIALTLFLAGVSLYAVFISRWVYSPLSDRMIGLQEEGRLYVLAYHPNEVASVYCIALLLCAYFAMQVKRLPLKILFGLIGLTDYLILVLTNTRTGIIIVSLAAAALLFLRLYSAGSKFLRILLYAALSLLLAAAVYQSFMLTNQWVAPYVVHSEAAHSEINPIAEAPAGEAAAPAEEAAPASTAETAPPESADADVELANRSFFTNLGTFSLRTEIWEAGFRYIADRPITLLIGSLDSQVAVIPIRMVGRNVYHMHNCWIEALLLGGIPGLLLYAFLMVQIAVHAVRVVLAARAGLALRFLACIPLLMMLNGLMEIYPSFSGNLMDMMFFLLSGYVVMQARRLSSVKPA